MSQADLIGSPANATPTAIAAVTPGVRGAIARAAQATGVDFSYLLAQARLESSLDPKAHASTSSAAGLYQFTKGTWGTMLARHGTAMGLGAGDAAMALRYDPDTSAMMAAQLAGDNTTALTTVLGRAPTSSELYLAHFLGTAGATRFLGALATDPAQSAAALLPKAAAANRAVFYDAGVAPRSLAEVMALMQARMDAAMGGVDRPTGNDAGITQTTSWPIDQQTQTTGSDVTAPVAAGSNTTSMADTLRTTFALAGDGAGNAPDFVRSAYGRMQALGL